MSGRRVVVVGMGDTGVLTAIALRGHAVVVGISTSPGLVSGQELGLRLARPQAWAHDYRVAYNRFRGLDGVRIVHGAVTGVDLERQTVQVAGGVEPYDVLVVATGVQNGFWRQPVVQDEAAVDEGLASNHRRLSEANSVAVVGGGAAAISCAAQISERWPDKQLDLYFPGERGLPQHHIRVWQAVSARLAAAGVGVHPGHRAVLPEDTDRMTAEPIVWSSGQAPVTADVVIWAVGRVAPNTGWLPADLLDERGFVRVDPNLRVMGHTNVFAVGDVAATDPSRASARNQGHKLLAHNVRAYLDGAPLRTYRPPRRRWGSVLGPLRDGLIVFAPNGTGYRLPAWSLEPLLQRVIVRRGIYGGIRPPRN